MTEEMVPRYFSDFVKENAEQHGELSTKIEKFKGDLSWRVLWVGGVVIASLTLAMGLFTTLG